MYYFESPKIVFNGALIMQTFLVMFRVPADKQSSAARREVSYHVEYAASVNCIEVVESENHSSRF